MNGLNFSRTMNTELRSLQFPGQEKSLLVLPTVQKMGAVAGFSTRLGGVSPPPFDSMNLSVQQGDSKANVAKNFAAFCRPLHIEPGSIAFCRQVHGDTIHVLHSVPNGLMDGDALVTSQRGVFLGVKTADCLPILLFDPMRGVVAAVHAGWRGTVLRIAGKVVRRMTDEFGTRASDVMALLGPAIGPCCYEVDEAVLSPFKKAFKMVHSLVLSPDTPQTVPVSQRETITEGFSDEHSRAMNTVRPIRSGRSAEKIESRGRLDLINANRFDLVSKGVEPENIFGGEYCTACQSELFFSHRRDNGRTGRHVAVVGLR